MLDQHNGLGYAGCSMSTPAKPRPKPQRKICSTPYCRNLTPVRKSGPRKGKSKGGKCYGCQMASWRANQPMRAAYLRLKHHAWNRCILFTITFEEFAGFATCTNLINHGGIHGEALTVDRIENEKGYVPGNIQCLTRSENSVKKAKRDAIRIQRGYAWQHMY